MPFLIRPPLHTIETDSPILAHIVIEPDHNERTILHDLRKWGWRITRHDFHDAEFVHTLGAIEKDVKKRRRQTHAIAGELHGYRERLTLEGVWEAEVERALSEDVNAPRIPRQREENVRAFREIDVEGREQVVEHWLKAIDRTRQLNGLLQYTDPGREFPRLIEHGLDHHGTDYSRQPAWVQHQTDSDQRNAAKQRHEHTTTSKPLPRTPQRIPHPRIPSTKHTTNKRLPHLPLKPCCLLLFPRFKHRRTSIYSLPSSACPLPPSRFLEHLSPVPGRHSTPSPIHSPTLIFPCAPLIPHTYTHLTRPGIPRPKNPITALTPPGVGCDPYGWLAWDRVRERGMRELDGAKGNRVKMGGARIEGVRAQWKFFLRRERRGLGSKEMLRRDLRERKILGEGIVRRRGVEELVRRLRVEEMAAKERGGVGEIGKGQDKVDTDEDHVLMFADAWKFFGLD